MDPDGTGTLWADPMSLPSSSGMTRPMAFAAPVEFGTMLTAAARLRRWREGGIEVLVHAFSRAISMPSIVRETGDGKRPAFSRGPG